MKKIFNCSAHTHVFAKQYEVFHQTLYLIIKLTEEKMRNLKQSTRVKKIGGFFDLVSPNICINLHLCDVLLVPGPLAVGFCLPVAPGKEQAGIMPARKPRMGHFNCLNPEQDVPTV